MNKKTNELLNETINRKLIQTAFSKKLRVHLKLTDGTWRNGIVKEITPDFFFFIDDENKRLEPFFFLQVRGVDPFVEDTKNECL